jgi:hypothetical protein
MRARRILSVVLGLALAAVLSAVSVQSASASPAADNCVAVLAPAASPSATSEVVDFHCFATFGQALSYGSGGAVSPHAGLAAAAQLASPSDITQVLLGIEYSATNYGGSTLMLFGNGGPGCVNGTTYGFGTMPSGWDNHVRSARGYSYCFGVHYADTNYNGDATACTPDCASMGSLDLRTSSVRFV